MSGKSPRFSAACESGHGRTGHFGRLTFAALLRLRLAIVPGPLIVGPRRSGGVIVGAAAPGSEAANVGARTVQRMCVAGLQARSDADDPADFGPVPLFVMLVARLDGQQQRDSACSRRGLHGAIHAPASMESGEVKSPLRYVNQSVLTRAVLLAPRCRAGDAPKTQSMQAAKFLSTVRAQTRFLPEPSGSVRH
ncbi:hypothetical protein BRAS3843_1780056 [Bradyrhizobium sp. STM 3843]|nr:hypothetical protein BRAS3843_1780056 [Bradyrhizobium sp. STM 3843]